MFDPFGCLEAILTVNLELEALPSYKRP